WQETSRTKPLSFPQTVRLPRVAHPVVQPPRPSLPKFDAHRRHPKSAPAPRSRNFLSLKRFLQFLQPRLHFLPPADRFALPRNVRPDLALPRPTPEIRFRFLPARFADLAANPDLPFQLRPIKHQRRPRILRQLTPLGAQIIREKNESALVESFQ